MGVRSDDTSPVHLLVEPGWGLKSGVCLDGCRWIEFDASTSNPEPEEFEDPEYLWEGFLCLDGGEEVPIDQVTLHGRQTWFGRDAGPYCEEDCPICPQLREVAEKLEREEEELRARLRAERQEVGNE